MELNNLNRLIKFFHKLHSQLEDIAFSFIQRIPEKFIPYWLMDRLEKYLDRRIRELKQESIRMTWRNMYLHNAVDDMRKSN